MAEEQVQASTTKRSIRNEEKVLIQDKVGTLQFFYDVDLTISVELGRAECSLDRLLKLKKGSVIELTKLPEEPLDIRVNNKLLAQGEAVVVNDKFGIRVTQIISPDGELEALASSTNNSGNKQQFKN